MTWLVTCTIVGRVFLFNCLDYSIENDRLICDFRRDPMIEKTGMYLHNRLWERKADLPAASCIVERKSQIKPAPFIESSGPTIMDDRGTVPLTGTIDLAPTVGCMHLQGGRLVEIPCPKIGAKK